MKAILKMEKDMVKEKCNWQRINLMKDSGKMI